jgi:thiamine-phosphate pyrophosphorylase
VVTPSGIVLLTDRRLARRPLAGVVASAQPDWVILRERDLPLRERRDLADRLRALLPPGRLIVAGPDPLGGAAVHLAARDPLPARGDAGADARPDDEPADPEGGVAILIGRSCHGVPSWTAEDYVTLSPIFPTVTKPGYGPPLGPARAGRIAAETAFRRPPHGKQSRVDGRGGVPWLALGGVDSASRVAACMAAGAAGVAVMGAVMRAAEPGALVAELRAGLGVGTP